MFVVRRGAVVASGVVVLALVVAFAMGAAIALGDRQRTVALAVGLATIAAIATWIGSRRAAPGFVAVEGPVLLLLASTLVWRQRDADALASNPLDPAGMFRLVCVGAALALGALALTAPARDDGRVTTRPFRFYCAYVAVVFVGVPLSLNPTLTAYRGLELLAAVVVLAGAFRIAGMSAIRRIETVLYRWIVFLVTTAWLGVLFFPGEALTPSDTPVRFQLHGIVPGISSNGLGLLGLVLTAWSLLARSSREPWRPVRRAWLPYLACLGTVTFVFAQYRTGYIAAAVAIVLYIAVRSRLAVIWAIACAIVIASLWGSILVQRAEPVVLRGQTPDQAAQLSSRLTYWTAALPVWRESPWVGKGLLTATRFEVLAELGHEETSTIHGTWVEALVGTGVVGVAFLALMILTTYARAFRTALTGGRLVPFVLVTLLLVRSVTGATFELFGTFAVLTLTIALGLRDEVRLVRPIPEITSDRARLPIPA